MNMAEYGGQLQRIGLGNLRALSDIEANRLDSAYAQKRLDSEARSTAIGGMAGTVAGAAKGVYETRKGDHEADQDTQELLRGQEIAGIKNENVGRRIAARARGMSEAMRAEDPDLQDLPLPEAYKRTKYDVFADLYKQLVDMGLMS